QPRVTVDVICGRGQHPLDDAIVLSVRPCIREGLLESGRRHVIPRQRARAFDLRKGEAMTHKESSGAVSRYGAEAGWCGEDVASLASMLDPAQKGTDVRRAQFGLQITKCRGADTCPAVRLEDRYDTDRRVGIGILQQIHRHASDHLSGCFDV